jgi:hypothetical protein
MNNQRYVAIMKSLLERAIVSGDSDLIKQYTWGLFYAQSDAIKELQKELARKNLEHRYRKAG